MRRERWSRLRFEAGMGAGYYDRAIGVRIRSAGRYFWDLGVRKRTSELGKMLRLVCNNSENQESGKEAYIQLNQWSFTE